MQLAHQLYEHKLGKRFDLRHWWLLLKDAPKWEAFCDRDAEVTSKRLKENETKAYSNMSSPSTPSTPGTSSTPIAPGSEDTPTEGGGLLRPIRRKAAKRKVKEKVEDPVLDILSKELT